MTVFLQTDFLGCDFKLEYPFLPPRIDEVEFFLFLRITLGVHIKKSLRIDFRGHLFFQKCL